MKICLFIAGMMLILGMPGIAGFLLMMAVLLD